MSGKLFEDRSPPLADGAAEATAAGSKMNGRCVDSVDSYRRIGGNPGRWQLAQAQLLHGAAYVRAVGLVIAAAPGSGDDRGWTPFDNNASTGADIGGQRIHHSFGLISRTAMRSPVERCFTKMIRPFRFALIQQGEARRRSDGRRDISHSLCDDQHVQGRSCDTAQSAGRSGGRTGRESWRGIKHLALCLTAAPGGILLGMV